MRLCNDDPCRLRACYPSGVSGDVLLVFSGSFLAASTNGKHKHKHNIPPPTCVVLLHIDSLDALHPFRSQSLAVLPHSKSADDIRQQSSLFSDPVKDGHLFGSHPRPVPGRDYSADRNIPALGNTGTTTQLRTVSQPSSGQSTASKDTSSGKLRSRAVCRFYATSRGESYLILTNVFTPLLHSTIPRHLSRRGVPSVWVPCVIIAALFCRRQLRLRAVSRQTLHRRWC